jgi:uncharacterized phosphosugar-binding protein
VKRAFFAAERKQMSLIPGAQSYMDAVRKSLDAIAESQAEAIDRSAQAVVRTIESDGIVYLFGTGHSHMLCEEGHYRAGGLAAVCPVLHSSLMLHEGAVLSTQLERTSGIAPQVLARYRPTERDLIVIFSNSGVNNVPVEAAVAAKKIGMTVIAVIAADYAAQAPVGSMGKKLSELADIVLDNQGPPGDALVEIDGNGLRVGPLSTIAGAFILNAILTEAVDRMVASSDVTPPVYVSANMPGAREHNAALIEEYRTRNPHL